MDTIFWNVVNRRVIFKPTLKKIHTRRDFLTHTKKKRLKIFKFILGIHFRPLRAYNKPKIKINLLDKICISYIACFHINGADYRWFPSPLGTLHVRHLFKNLTRFEHSSQWNVISNKQKIFATKIVDHFSKIIIQWTIV